MLTLIQRIILYIVILIAIYIFVKTSQIKLNGRELISLKYRVLIALFFPLVIVIGVILSSFILAIIIILGFIVFLYIKFFRKKKINFRFRLK